MNQSHIYHLSPSLPRMHTKPATLSNIEFTYAKPPTQHQPGRRRRRQHIFSCCLIYMKITVKSAITISFNFASSLPSSLSLSASVSRKKQQSTKPHEPVRVLQKKKERERDTECHHARGRKIGYVWKSRDQPGEKKNKTKQQKMETNLASLARLSFALTAIWGETETNNCCRR